VIINARELKNGDVVERPGGAWLKISKVKKDSKVVRFVADGKPYVLPEDYGVRIR